MTTTVRPPGQSKQNRDPSTAAMLSIIPGLGQLYNGEMRKGFLFLTVAGMNFLLFLGMCLTDQILASLHAFGETFHMKPNTFLVKLVAEGHIGSAVSVIMGGFFLLFIAYAVRDAYDHASLRRRKIYPDMVIELPEATSGSYIFHFTFMATLFILAMFFLIPPPPRAQITDIEFIENQPKVQHKVESKRKAEHNSENVGKHNPKKPVTAAGQAANKPQPAAKPAPKAPSPTKAPTPTPKAQTAPAPHPTPTPSPRPSPTPSPQPQHTPSPRPAPMPSARPSPMAAPTPMATPRPMAAPSAVPMPHASPSRAPSPSPTMSPVPMGRSGSGAPSPMPAARPAPSGGFFGFGAPAPVQLAHGGGGAPGFAPSVRPGGTTGGGAFSAPMPMQMGGGGGGGGSNSAAPLAPAGGGGGRPHGGGGGGASGAPAPIRAGGGGGPSGGGGSSGMVAPSVPRSGGSGGGGGNGQQGNPDKNNRNGAPSTAASADVDFGPYMADLQRRIKKHWFPPKGNESKRVMVVFKVHTGGELSDLRIDRSSGVQIADKAALDAVQNAAPFRPLPAGAPDAVDIQFTFDYNVFNGGGHGTFRQF